jgi:hypothetical protein
MQVEALGDSGEEQYRGNKDGAEYMIVALLSSTLYISNVLTDSQRQPLKSRAAY